MIEDELLQFCTILETRNYSLTTIKNYSNALVQFNKWNLSGMILSKDLLFEYFEYLKTNDKSYSSIKNSIMSLMLFSELVLGICIKNNLLTSIKRLYKLPDILSIDEVKQVINSIENIKHKALISLIYSCGLRISECINMKLNDIDSSRMIIKIVQKKEKKDRFVSLSQKLLDLLQIYYIEYKPIEYLFKGKFKAEYSARSIQQVLKKALDKCTITKRITVHSLRHSYATHLVEQGTDIRIIQEILGHKDIRSTQIYSHISSPKISKINNPYDLF
jgi:site-specific recombinase XerD